ncbi:hypothetical protein ACFQL4_00480 [Halosimplex aquaticum]
MYDSIESHLVTLERFDSYFKDNPAPKAELLTVIGRLYAQTGDWSKSLSYLVRGTATKPTSSAVKKELVRSIKEFLKIIR